MTVDVTPDTYILGGADSGDKFKTIVNNFGHKFIFIVNDNVKVNDCNKSAIYHRCQRHRW